MPRLTSGPFRYRRYADAYLKNALALRPRAGQASRHLTFGVEPDVSRPTHSGLLARGVHRRSHRRARARGPQLLGCAALIACRWISPRAAWPSRSIPRATCSHSFMDLNNLALARFSAEERQRARRPYVPWRRPRFDAQRRRRLRRPAAEPVRARRAQLLYRAGRRARSNAGARDHQPAHEAGTTASSSASSRRSTRASRPRRRFAIAPSRPRAYIPADQLGTTDDCGFSPFCDDTSTSRDKAFAKIRARVRGHGARRRELG